MWKSECSIMSNIDVGVGRADVRYLCECVSAAAGVVVFSSVPSLSTLPCPVSYILLLQEGGSFPGPESGVSSSSRK